MSYIKKKKTEKEEKRERSMMKHNIWDKYFPCASVCLSWAHSLHLAKMLWQHKGHGSIKNG